MLHCCVSLAGLDRPCAGHSHAPASLVPCLSQRLPQSFLASVKQSAHGQLVKKFSLLPLHHLPYVSSANAPQPVRGGVAGLPSYIDLEALRWISAKTAEGVDKHLSQGYGFLTSTALQKAGHDHLAGQGFQHCVHVGIFDWRCGPGTCPSLPSNCYALLPLACIFWLYSVLGKRCPRSLQPFNCVLNRCRLSGSWHAGDVEHLAGKTATHEHSSLPGLLAALTLQGAFEEVYDLATTCPPD